MSVFDYSEVIEKDDDVYTLKFKGTAYCVTQLDEDGEENTDTEEYLVLGYEDEFMSEADIYKYVDTLDPGAYNIHQYKWMVIGYSEDEGLIWDEFDAGGTECDEYEVSAS